MKEILTTDQFVERYQDLYKQKFGEQISNGHAHQELMSLISLVSIINNHN